MEQENLSLETGFSFRLLKAAHRVQLRHQRALDGVALTLSQYWVLKLVCDGEANRPSDVARRLGVHPGDVTRLVRHLSARGLLTRSRRGDDQRNLHLAATPKGEQVASAADKIIATTDAELRSLMGTEAADQMIDSLATLDDIH